MAAWLFLLWLFSADSSAISWIYKVVFFAVLVIVPLGLSLLEPVDQEGSFTFYALAVFAQPIAALLAILSFTIPQSVYAAALASPWLVVTLFVALFGFSRLVSRGPYPLAELTIDAGLLYLPVAGGWLIVDRLGIQPFGYGELIIVLTVVHFHFAGFATPIISGMTGRVLATIDHPRRLYLYSIIGIVLAMPLVAAGITFTPWLGLLGTLLLTTALVMHAVLTLGWIRPEIAPAGGQLLLSLGALSSCLAMMFACLYSFSLVTHTLIFTIPTMAITHGVLNAFGFVTVSLFAWSRIAPRALRPRWPPVVIA